MPADPRRAIAATDTDLATRRAILALTVDVVGSQGAMAEILNVARSTVTQWITGDREVEWHVVLAAVQRAIRRYPDQAPRLVQALAERALDTTGTWVPDPEPDGEEQSVEEGVSEVVETLGQLARARKTGNGLEVASRELVRGAVSLVGAARRSAA
jgi:hypothetical protein